MAQITFSADVDPRSIADFTRAISDFQRGTQRDMRTALRIATVDLCKSLRSRTRKSPKLMPKSAFRFGKSDPQWLTTSKHGLMRRMVRKEFPGGARKNYKGDFVFWQPCRTVYKSRRLKNGGIAESWTKQSEAQLIRDARARWGKIWNWGLAKQTWGWFMWRLFNLNDKGMFLNPRVNITHRHVGGGIIEKREPLPDGTISMDAPIRCDISIINRLRYIRRALAPGALSASIESARRSLVYKAQRNVRSRKLG